MAREGTGAFQAVGFVSRYFAHHLDEPQRKLDFSGFVKQGQAYALVVRATPGFNDPEDYSTSLICRKGIGESEEIVRIDNSHGKGTHIHRLYRRDEPEEPFDGDLWEAVKHIEENWRAYTRRHRS